MIEVIIAQSLRTFAIIIACFVIHQDAPRLYQAFKNRDVSREYLRCFGIFIYALGVVLGGIGLITLVPSSFDVTASPYSWLVIIGIWLSFSLSLSLIYAHGSPRPYMAFVGAGIFLVSAFFIQWSI